MVNSYNETGQAIQVDGENSGTWGDITNTNWYIQALLNGGSASIDLSTGDVTVPNADGVADSGKNTIFITTGVLAADTNLILPTKERFFIVTNNCTAAFAVTVKTTAGTGVVVPQTQSILVYCDGTNIVSVAGGTGGGGSGAGGVYPNNTVTSSGTSQALDYVTYSSYFITLTASCSITFAASPTSGSNLDECLLILKQDATGGWPFSFPASVVWAGTASPTTPPTFGLAANTYTSIRLKTKDSGTTWLATVEGTGGSSSNVPVAGLYLVAGGGSRGNRSTDGATFISANPVFNIAGTAVTSMVYLPTYGRFVLMSPANGLVGNSVLYSANGSSYNFPSSASAISLVSGSLLYAFSNGNLIASNSGANFPFSLDGGLNFITKGPSGPAASVFSPNGWVGTANTALLCFSDNSGNVFASTVDGGVTIVGAVHSGFSGIVNNAFAGGFFFVGDNAGNVAAKASANGTALTTVTSALSSTAFLGAAYNGTNFIIYNANSLSYSSTVAGPYTSATTAFFTTAGITGSIVKLVASPAGIVVAVTSTGDVGRSTDGGISWTKLSMSANPLTGKQIYGAVFVDSAFWIFGDGGSVATSGTGSGFNLVPTVSWGAFPALCFAGG